MKFYNADGEPVEKEIEHIEWDIEAAEKGGFEHFMMKEIFEQPKAVRDTITPRIRNGHIVLDDITLTAEELAPLHKNQHRGLWHGVPRGRRGKVRV